VRLDHLSYAAGPEGLGATVQRLGGMLGATFRDGGLHPGFGTRNFVLPLAGGVYLEVVGALDHPAADKAPFGQAVKARSESGGGWLAWVVAVDDIASVEARLGRSSVPGHRRRPDGVDLTWRQIGVLDLLDDPALPFFVQWEGNRELHPATDGDGPRIERVEICGDPAKVDDWVGGALAGMNFQVDWIDAEEPGLVTVSFATHLGSVRVD
jgi:hypothetical protein